MSFTVIIPARFASTRLPAKPLAIIDGKSMIVRVIEQALKSEAKHVIVATDDDRIKAHVEQRGYQAMMTAVDHESGTDRLQEVTHILKLDKADVVVNVQGDEPLIPPSVINQVAQNLMDHPQASAATLCEPILHGDDVFSPNAVKVVSDAHNMALYFSRAPIPWQRGVFDQPSSVQGDNLGFRHVGIYAYKVDVLNQFVTWPAAPIEQLESLEQLRILYNGHQIHVAPAIENVPAGVDTPQDLQRVQAYFNV